jgi:hypothetical protein
MSASDEFFDHSRSDDMTKVRGSDRERSASRRANH